MAESDLEAYVTAIHQSRKYRDLCPETIRDVIATELARHKSHKEALRQAKRRLHRLWAQFLGEPNHEASRRALVQAFISARDPDIRRVCLQIMRAHASSRERLMGLANFYPPLFARTGVPTRVLDLACALNPLSFRWMDLPRSIRYHAYDINQSTVRLINHYFHLEGLEPLAAQRDIFCSPPAEEGDIALLFKMYHCLEHRQRGAGWHVVEAVRACWVAVSFPTRNLANRAVDIVGNYEVALRSKATHRGWDVDRLDLGDEAILLVRKGPLEEDVR
jgi:16S rRNA (guanine(1405)-N(7))-methyltransferase